MQIDIESQNNKIELDFIELDHVIFDEPISTTVV